MWPGFRSRHTFRIGFLALDIGNGCAFKLARDDVRGDGLGLAKPPEPPHGLIELLEAVIEPDEPAVGTMLEVEPEPAD